MNGNESEAMRRLPRTCRTADRVLWFDEVDSTNTVARRLLAEAWPPRRAPAVRERSTPGARMHPSPWSWPIARPPAMADLGGSG